MRVISWNVNSLRARLERTLALLDRHEPDVLCLQETKVDDAKFPLEAFTMRGYKVARFGQPTYNGVAIVTKTPHEVADLERGFPGNPVPEEARAIAATVNGLRIWNLYVVNGKDVGTPFYERKLAWLDAYRAHVASAVAAQAPFLVVGDFNIAPDDRDVHDPEGWRGRILCSDAERARYAALVDAGLTDLHRVITDEAGVYTWWDYRGFGFQRGDGLRIDLALGNAPVVAGLQSVSVDREERRESTGEGKPSDHAPLIVDLDLA